MSRVHGLARRGATLLVAPLLIAGAAFAADDTKTMQAIVMRENGGPEVLKLEQVAIPQPAAGQVRLRISAAAVNPVDWKRREGRFRPPPPQPGAPEASSPTPASAPDLSAGVIPGFDAAGTIDALGEGVSGFEVGDAVYAALHSAPQGAYAQYAVVSADNVARRPAKLDDREAAGLVTAGVTALRVIRAAGVKPGQTVLVQGGAGGVGSVLVQILHSQGATVFATASARNADYLKGLGASRVIDYTTGRFEDSVQGVDVVIDTVGGKTTARSVAVVRPGGTLISIANRAPAEACEKAGIQCPAFLPSSIPAGVELRELAALADAGKLSVHVDRVFPLAEAGAAQALSQEGRTRGKIVLSVP